MEFNPYFTNMCNTVFRHILPASLMNDSMNANDSFYEELLSHGEPVIVYMHGNSGSRGSPHRVELYTLLRNMNYHVIAFDYRSKILI
jgi:abhydrolase domain-containing protein 12